MSSKTTSSVPLATTERGRGRIQIRSSWWCSMRSPNSRRSCRRQPSAKTTLMRVIGTAEGDWYGLTPSHTGVYTSLGGYLGLTIGWVEGFEINFFGAVLGFDIRRPALKFSGFGRLGMAAGPGCLSIEYQFRSDRSRLADHNATFMASPRCIDFLG